MLNFNTCLDMARGNCRRLFVILQCNPADTAQGEPDARQGTTRGFLPTNLGLARTQNRESPGQERREERGGATHLNERNERNEGNERN